MLFYKVILNGNAYVKGERKCIERLLNEDEFRDAFTFSVASKNYNTHKFDKEDISIINLYEFDEENEEGIMTICCTILAESLLETSKYNTYKEISDNYYSIDIYPTKIN